jgi:hypothetical protein
MMPLPMRKRITRSGRREDGSNGRRLQREHLGVLLAKEVTLPLTSLNGKDLQMV